MIGLSLKCLFKRFLFFLSQSNPRWPHASLQNKVLTGPYGKMKKKISKTGNLIGPKLYTNNHWMVPCKILIDSYF